MQNTVKENWKRRICATITVLVVMCVIAALWSYGRSFAKVLQAGSGDVARIVVTRRDSTAIEYTDRESIDAFMSCINGFRYNIVLDNSDRSGCWPDNLVKLFDPFGRQIRSFSLYDDALMIDPAHIYRCSTPYFSSLCQQLEL